jgi:molybdopterin biosynthesis enzyme
MKMKIPLEEAQSLLETYCGSAGTERVSLLEAHGRVLAQDITAPINQPPFDRSPLDGYALRAEDSVGASKERPVRLKVIEEVFAGGLSALFFPYNAYNRNHVTLSFLHYRFTFAFSEN